MKDKRLKWSDVENSLFSKEEREETKEVVSIVASIVQRRLDLELTQQEVADRAGLTQSVIGRFESFRAVPRIDTLSRIASALGLQIKLEKSGEQL